MKHTSLLILLTLFIGVSKLSAQTMLTIQTDKPIAEVQPTMWGIFFEDINYGADGGLYAELVKNRSFEFFQPLMGWTQYKNDKFAVSNAGEALIISRADESTNPRFARINVLENKGYGLSNEGFFGMGIKKDMTYTFTIMASQQEGNSAIRIELADANGKSLGEASVSPTGKDWKKYTITLRANATEKKAKLNLWFEGKGTMDIDMISLFPSDTWKQRPGGLRNDLIQLLADMKPGFVRFPGGCIVEGRDLATRYQWKKTVGQVENRELIVNRWNTEFKHRPAPDYFQSFGLGFYEYFQLAEDIGAEPLPILSCGMACQFNTAELVPMNDLDPYIQDALDLIEFANGDVTTTWGKLRASMGHPTPFNLKLIGVGNEQWGPQYIERYKVFSSAIRAQYPNVKIVSGSGPFPDGELFDYASKELKELNAEIVDEHYYRNPEWFLQNATRYDKYDRKGPKIFAGEYAAQSKEIASPDNKNNWQCALSEAAFMTGLERNADVVHLSSYAPLFAHAEGWQWTPDLIWFDNLNSYGTPNYYVQKLFSNHKGTNVLSILSGSEKVTGQNGLYASSVWDKNTKEIIVKLVNTLDKEQTINLKFDGAKKLQTKGTVIVLKGNSLEDVNSFENPKWVVPVEKSIAGKSKNYTVSLAPNSFSVVRIKAL